MNNNPNDKSRGQDQQSQQRMQEQQQQRQGGSGVASLSQVKEHMDVVGSDGTHIGTVDKVEGNRIKLTKKDSSSDGQHHYIDAGSISSIEGNKVKLSTSGKGSMS